MKATMRNSRNGSAKHNDRDFDLEHERNDGHIDVNRQDKNVYWHCYQEQSHMTFYEAETKYYKEHYEKTVQTINKRAKAARHKERMTSVTKLYENKKTMPEETILQIGNRNEAPDLDKFTQCVLDYIEELKKFDAHVHIIDWAIHGDEETPHAHIRKVYDYEDRDGLLRLSTDKALQMEGFERPDPNAQESMINNRKISFDNHMRKKWYDICIEHEIEIDIEPEDNITHYEKEEYVRQQIEKEQEHLKQLQQEIAFANQRLQNINMQQQQITQKYEETKKLQKQLKHEMEKDIKEYKKHVSEKHAAKFLKQHDIKDKDSRVII